MTNEEQISIYDLTFFPERKVTITITETFYFLDFGYLFKYLIPDLVKPLKMCTTT